MSGAKAPELERHCGSWVIVIRSNGKAFMETFEKRSADSIAAKYADLFEVVTAAQWLARVNRQIKEVQS